METIVLKAVLLPFMPLVFAYLEQGGNLFAEKTLDQPTPRNLMTTFFFSVIYAFVAAAVATWLQIDLALLMINYGFGFAMVALLLELEWQRLPTFTLRRVHENPHLRLPLGMALVGFVVSAYFVIQG